MSVSAGLRRGQCLCEMIREDIDIILSRHPKGYSSCKRSSPMMICICIMYTIVFLQVKAGEQGRRLDM